MYWGTGGRFLQTDPVGYTADLNLYTYVGNDPIGSTDPTGECKPDFIHCGPSYGDIEGANVTYSGIGSTADNPVKGDIGSLASPATISANIGGVGPVINAVPRSGPSESPIQLAARGPDILVPDDNAAGPHSSFRRDRSGQVSNYETYEQKNPKTGKWSPELRYRGSGRPHGGVKPPLVLEKKPGAGLGAKPSVPRPARPGEIPAAPFVPSRAVPYLTLPTPYPLLECSVNPAACEGA